MFLSVYIAMHVSMQGALLELSQLCMNGIFMSHLKSTTGSEIPSNAA